MRLGIIDETALKEKSISLQIPFPNLLYGYVLEETMRLISGSEYADFLWLANPQILGLDSYKKGQNGCLQFYYMESSKKIPENKLIPGQKLSWKLATYMIAVIFSKERSVHISWKGMAVQKEHGFQWNLMGGMDGMEVPLEVKLIPFEDSSNCITEKGELSLFMEEKKTIVYRRYPFENLLADNLCQIMSQLELIDSMEAYETVDEILRTQSISGRRLVDELTDLTAKTPKILRLKRMQQLESYRDYTYMKKRWEKYVKATKRELPEWKDVIERLVKFTEPVWRAVCKKEIFFDDWMPELERFLG